MSPFPLTMASRMEPSVPPSFTLALNRSFWVAIGSETEVVHRGVVYATLPDETDSPLSGSLSSHRGHPGPLVTGEGGEMMTHSTSTREMERLLGGESLSVCGRRGGSHGGTSRELVPSLSRYVTRVIISLSTWARARSRSIDFRWRVVAVEG